MKNKQKQESVDGIHVDLLAAQRQVYVASGIVLTRLRKEDESRDYGACGFDANHQRVQYRVAKVTPKKTGQFVTLWKRIGAGPILPYDRDDPVDLFVVSVRTPEHFGQFVFPKAVLCERGVVSKDGQGGKRAIRVYPPWDLAKSRQAKISQLWQCRYFFEISVDGSYDSSRVRDLFL